MMKAFLMESVQPSILHCHAYSYPFSIAGDKIVWYISLGPDPFLVDIVTKSQSSIWRKVGNDEKP
jgi:hypothetical protein